MPFKNTKKKRKRIFFNHLVKIKMKRWESFPGTNVLYYSNTGTQHTAPLFQVEVTSRSSWHFAWTLSNSELVAQDETWESFPSPPAALWLTDGREGHFANDTQWKSQDNSPDPQETPVDFFASDKSLAWAQLTILEWATMTCGLVLACKLIASSLWVVSCKVTGSGLQGAGSSGCCVVLG